MAFGREVHRYGHQSKSWSGRGSAGYVWRRLEVGGKHHHSRPAVGAGERLRVGLGHVQSGGGGWAPCRATVGAGERLRMGRGHVQSGGRGRAPCSAAVGAGERLRVGRGHVQ